MKRIVMRADDLGYSEAVNLGIHKSIKDGFINNVGLMVNMECAKHGVELVKDENICLGQHVCISSGYPVSDPSSIPSLVSSSGAFRSSSDIKNSKEDILLEEAILEIEAQYEKFVLLTGKQPGYFDGHAVSSPNFFKALEIVARNHNLKYSPIPISITEPVQIGNSLVYLNGGSDLKRTPFECLKEIVNKDKSRIELIIYHPGYLDAYIMNNSSLNVPRVYELEMICSQKSKEYLVENNVECITYYDL